ncbi:hypothetical protein HPB48_002367 [Haemaphysalis longicornis]|uniref:Uncharacterized protein n=1 Tax=Haemaphysalis longicornis TaxID=44386 RepID=A0A9J6GHZ0_HAELO|nr:hypothetical protein HPB48_002367 [Haemaphysalis longicornis]
MMFGHLIDRSCILWQTSCSGEDGSCAIYDNSVMGMNLFRLVISVKSASIFFFFCASLTSRTQASTGAGHLIPGDEMRAFSAAIARITGAVKRKRSIEFAIFKK